ncbi:MAG: oligosaccharide flippase family protein [bacterium]|nr:oligosaccharide flippase family protein [bacterium]
MPAFIKQIFTTYLARMLAMLLGTVTTIAVARTLGPEGRGWFSAATTLAGMGAILGSLGLPQVNAYYGAKEPELRGQLLGNSITITLAVTAVLGLLFSLGAHFFPTLICLPGLFLPLAVLYAGLLLALTLIQQLMIGMDLVNYYNGTEVALRLFQLTGTAALAVWGMRQADLYFACSALAFLPVTLVGVWLCSRRITEKVSCSLTLLKRSAAYSSRLYLIALFFNVFMGLDILATQFFCGPEETGIYSIAASIRQILLVFTLVVQTLLLPRLVKLESLRERTAETRLYTFLTLGGATVIALLAWLSADYLVFWLFGQEFVPCTAALAWMLPGYVIYSAAAVLAVLMQAEQQPWVSVLPMFLTLLTHLGLCSVCIPSFGLSGGAIAYSGACFLYLIAQWCVNKLYIIRHS